MAHVKHHTTNHTNPHVTPYKCDHQSASFKFHNWTTVRLCFTLLSNYDFCFSLLPQAPHQLFVSSLLLPAVTLSREAREGWRFLDWEAAESSWNLVVSGQSHAVVDDHRWRTFMNLPGSFLDYHYVHIHIHLGLWFCSHLDEFLFAGVQNHQLDWPKRANQPWFGSPLACGKDAPGQGVPLFREQLVIGRVGGMNSWSWKQSAQIRPDFDLPIARNCNLFCLMLL